MSHKFVFGLLFILVAAAAQAGTGEIDLSELQSALDKVVGLFTSDIMKVIFSIGLGGLFIAFALNRENPELKKRFLFWIIGVGGLLGLSQIMDVFFSSGALL